MEDHHHQLYAMQLASASMLPMALKVAIELGVFDIIQGSGLAGRLSPSQIVSHFPAHSNPDAAVVLDRILSLLASHSILTCSLCPSDGGKDCDSRLYGLAPVAKYFLKDKSHGGTLSPFVAMVQDKVMMDIWYHMKDAVLEGGIPFERAHGMSGPEFMGKNPGFGQIFKSSMTDFNPLIMEEILRTYDGFRGLTSLVDVGGGDGSVLNMIRSRYPEIAGINFDLPAVLEKSNTYPGIENVGGDMFTSIPKGDAVFMKWILHGWEDEQCIKILRNCFEALPTKGKVIAIDMVLPDLPQASDVATQSLFQFYLSMASINPKGRERGEREFLELGTKAGFSTVRVVCAACNFSVVEFLKSVTESRLEISSDRVPKKCVT